MAKDSVTLTFEVTETKRLVIDTEKLSAARISISRMFTWSSSREGRGYWQDVADKLDAYMEQVAEAQIDAAVKP